MASDRGKNVCELEFVVQEVELKDGKKGPWAKVRGYYYAEDRDGNPLEVEIRLTAFGVLADRFNSVEGETVTVRLAMGGWKADNGKVWPDYTCVSVSRPWGDKPARPPREAGTDGMKRGYQPPPPLPDDELDLPF